MYPEKFEGAGGEWQENLGCANVTDGRRRVGQSRAAKEDDRHHHPEAARDFDARRNRRQMVRGTAVSLPEQKFFFVEKRRSPPL